MSILKHIRERIDLVLVRGDVKDVGNWLVRCHHFVAEVVWLRVLVHGRERRGILLLVAGLVGNGWVEAVHVVAAHHHVLLHLPLI